MTRCRREIGTFGLHSRMSLATSTGWSIDRVFLSAVGRRTVLPREGVRLDDDMVYLLSVKRSVVRMKERSPI